MARPLRILFEGAWYHVINRGAAKKNIFHNDADKQMFLQLLDRIQQRYKIEIHAYCLMDNHYHLLIRTPLPNLSQAIKYLNGLYVQKYNALYQIDGPLFRGRFKSIVVENDEYLLHLTRYIHLNPVAANMCQLPWEYTWSSCKNYLNIKTATNWLYVTPILSMLSLSDSTRKYQKYLDFLCDDINDLTIEKIKNSLPIIGSTNFICNIAANFLLHEDQDEVPDKKLLIKVILPTFGNMIKTICEYYNINEEAIFISRRGKHNLYRDVAIYLGIECCSMPLKELALEFKMLKKTSLSLIYRKMLKRISVDDKLKNDVDEIVAKVSKIEM